MSTHCPKCKTKGDFRETPEAYDYYCRTCENWCSKIQKPYEQSDYGIISVPITIQLSHPPTTQIQGLRFKVGDDLTDGIDIVKVMDTSPSDYHLLFTNGLDLYYVKEFVEQCFGLSGIPFKLRTP